MWNVTKSEFERYECTFRSLIMGSDKLNGQNGRNYFMRSNLPVNILGKIWQLSDGDNDGFLSLSEFIIASKLIELCISGNSLPDIVPRELRDSINNLIWGQKRDTIINYDNLSELFRTEETVVKKLDVKVSFNSSPIYEIFSKLKSPNLDLIEGKNVKEYFLKSGLDKSILAEIWEISDKDMDGCLNLSEFTTAYRLIEENLEKLNEKQVIQSKEYSLDNSLINNTGIINETHVSNIHRPQSQFVGNNDVRCGRSYTDRVSSTSNVEGLKISQNLQRILNEERSKVSNYNELYKNLNEKEAILQNKIDEVKSKNNNLRKSNTLMENNIEEQKLKIEQIKNKEKTVNKTNANDNSFNFFNIDDLYTSSNKFRSKDSFDNEPRKQDSGLIDLFGELKIEAASSNYKTTDDIGTNETKEEFDDLYKNMNLDCKSNEIQNYDNIIIVDNESDNKRVSNNIKDDSYNVENISLTKRNRINMGKSVDELNREKNIKEENNINDKNLPNSSNKKHGFKLKNPFKTIVRGLSVSNKKNKSKEDESSNSPSSNKDSMPPYNKNENIMSNEKLGSADDVKLKINDDNKREDLRKVKTPEYEFINYNDGTDNLTNNIFDIYNDREDTYNSEKQNIMSSDIKINTCDSATECVSSIVQSPRDNYDEFNDENVQEYNPPLAYIAKIPYRSDECEFSFNKNDILYVTHKCNEYLYAEINSIGDWFPLNYVALYTNSPMSNFDKSYTLKEYYIALYDNEVENEDDIPFEEGDILYGSKEVDGWVQGYSNGRSGIFARNYVEKINNIDVKDICKIISNYKSKYPYELSLNVNDNVAFLHRNICGWCIGVDVYQNIGFFPSSCIYNN